MKNKEDFEKLGHIQRAINKIEKYTEDVTFEGFEENEMLQDAVFKNLEIIGEACLLYTSPSPRDRTRSRMPSSA